MLRWLDILMKARRAEVGEPPAANSLRNERGLTLIEVVVSVAILMMLLLAISATLIASFRADTRNQERHIASQLARQVTERIIDFASQGSVSFNALVANNSNGAIPAQPAIPGVRPAIPAQPPSDHISDDFDGDGASDYGAGTKRTYVYQLIIDDIDVGGQTGLLKVIVVRIYYANQNAANPSVDLTRHPNPGGQRPRRYQAPLAEVSTYIALP